MIDILKDIVKHTHGLGFLDLVKITGDDKETAIDSMAEDRSVILQGSFHKPQPEMTGTFGMPQMGKLDIHLKCPEYKEKANITVLSGERNGATVPTGIHFENEKGDFKNDYRFMNAEIINEKLKTVKFKGVKWDVEIEPTVASVQRFNFQATANTEHNSFVVRTEDGNLVFTFGDQASLVVSSFSLPTLRAHLTRVGVGRWGRCYRYLNFLTQPRSHCTSLTRVR